MLITHEFSFSEIHAFQFLKTRSRTELLAAIVGFKKFLLITYLLLNTKFVILLIRSVNGAVKLHRNKTTP